MENVKTFKKKMRRVNRGTQTYYNYNTNAREVSDWRLSGGTALTVDRNLGSHKAVNGSGKDIKGLGRWTWFRARGRNNIHTRFISA